MWGSARRPGTGLRGRRRRLPTRRLRRARYADLLQVLADPADPEHRTRKAGWVTGCGRSTVPQPMCGFAG